MRNRQQSDHGFHHSAATALAAAALFTCISAAAAPSGARAMPVEATKVISGTVNVDISAVGSLAANESVMIRPEIIGRVAGIHFEEGQWIEKGDTLITLDPAEYRARLEESTAQVQLNELSFKRSKQLLRKNLASQQQYDQDAAKLAEAKARQALDRERLRKTVLRAPFSGMLGLRRVSPGDVVQPGQDLVNLEDIGAIKVDFQVPEVYLTQLAPGLEVTVQTDAFPGQSFTGTVYVIAPRFDVQSRSIRLRARLPNADKKLRPGMFARVSLRVAQRRGALLVPEQALWPIGKDQFVYRVVDGKARLTKVTIGLRRKGQVEIVGGLAEHDVVITAGQMKIRNGAPVMVINKPSPPGKG